MCLCGVMCPTGELTFYDHFNSCDDDSEEEKLISDAFMFVVLFEVQLVN